MYFLLFAHNKLLVIVPNEGRTHSHISAAPIYQVNTAWNVTLLFIQNISLFLIASNRRLIPHNQLTLTMLGRCERYNNNNHNDNDNDNRLIILDRLIILEPVRINFFLLVCLFFCLFVFFWFKTLDCLQELVTASEPQEMYLWNRYWHSDCYFYYLYYFQCYIVLNSYSKYFSKWCTYFFKV